MKAAIYQVFATTKEVVAKNENDKKIVFSAWKEYPAEKVIVTGSKITLVGSFGTVFVSKSDMSYIRRNEEIKVSQKRIVKIQKPGFWITLINKTVKVNGVSSTLEETKIFADKIQVGKTMVKFIGSFGEILTEKSNVSNIKKVEGSKSEFVKDTNTLNIPTNQTPIQKFEAEQDKKIALLGQKVSLTKDLFLRNGGIIIETENGVEAIPFYNRRSILPRLYYPGLILDVKNPNVLEVEAEIYEDILGEHDDAKNKEMAKELDDLT